MSSTFGGIATIALASALATALPIDAIGAAKLKCDDPNLDSKFVPPASAIAPAWKNADARAKSYEISVPVGGKKSPVKFKVFPGGHGKGKGLVIFLCGGPGFSCVKEGRPQSVPPELDVAIFDYNGLGENKRNSTPAAMSIDGQADAAIGITDYLKYPKYSIYGESFGTTVATVAASRLSRGKNKPKMVILSGVVGSVESLEPDPSVTRAAERAWGRLNESQKAEFIKSYDEVAGKLSPENRDSLDAGLILGLKGGTAAAADRLKKFASGKRLDRKAPPPMTVEGNKLYRAAGCEQLPGRMAPSDKKYFGGRVRNTAIAVDLPGQPSPCDCPLLSKKYDSKNHQINGVPILYLNSKVDVATPLESAQYHIDNQTETKEKLLIALPDGKHGDLEASLFNCSMTIWSAANRGALSELSAKSQKILNDTCESQMPPTSNDPSVQ